MSLIIQNKQRAIFFSQFVPLDPDRPEQSAQITCDASSSEVNQMSARLKHPAVTLRFIILSLIIVKAIHQDKFKWGEKKQNKTMQHCNYAQFVSAVSEPSKVSRKEKN